MLQSLKATTGAELPVELQHTMITLAVGGNLHLAPIGPNPQKVLDFASGMYLREHRISSF
jgi:hypothetical protein